MRSYGQEWDPIPELESDLRLISLLKKNNNEEPSEEPLYEVRKALEEALKTIERSLHN